MCWKAKIGEIPFVGVTRKPLRLLKYWRGATFVVLLKDGFYKLKNPEEITINCDELDIFKDDSDNLVYLTNIDSDDECVTTPIIGIVYSGKSMKFFFENKTLVVEEESVQKKLLSLSFYEQLLGEEPESLKRPAQLDDVTQNVKKRKSESTDKPSSQPATLPELTDKSSSEPVNCTETESISEVSDKDSSGTESISEVSDKDSSGTESISEVSDKDSSGTESISEVSDKDSSGAKTSLQSIEPIKLTALDKKLCERVRYQRYKETFDQLINGTAVPSAELEISSRYLYVNDDPIDNNSLATLSAKIERNESLSRDMITCFASSDNEYHVISGSKRAQVLQRYPNRLVLVKRVDEKDANVYRLSQKIMDLTVDNSSPMTVVNVVSECIVFIGATKEEVSEWSADVKSYVFEGIVKKFGLDYIKLACSEPLTACFNKLQTKGVPITTHTISLALRKYKLNGKDTIEKMNAYCESEKKESLTKLEVDCRHVLKSKNLPNDVIDKFVDEFGHEPHFSAFVRSDSIRASQKVRKCSTLISRYKTFLKNKHSISPECNEKFSHEGDVTDLLGVCDLFLVDNASDVVFEKVGGMVNALICLLSVEQVDSTSNHIILLPDTNSEKDENGMTRNIIPVSLYMVHHGMIMPTSDLKETFIATNTPFSHCFSLQQASNFLGCYSCGYVSVNDCLKEVCEKLMSDVKIVHIKP